MRYFTMRRFSGFVGILTSIVMILSLTSTAHADDTDGMSAEQIANLRQQLPTAFYEDIQNGHKFAGVAFAGGQDALPTQVSLIRSGREFASNSSAKKTRLCDDYNDRSCFGFGQNAGAESYAEALIVIPPCTQDATAACIEGVSIQSSLGKTSGNFSRLIDNNATEEYKARLSNEEISNGNGTITSFQKNLVWPGNAAKNLPAASSPSIWQIPGAIHKGGADTYLARATLTMKLYENGKVNFTGLGAEIVPFVETYGSTYHPPTWYNRSGKWAASEWFPRANTKPLASYDSPQQKNNITCAYEETGKCGLAYRFADGTSAELTLRIPRSLGGWFYGRMANTDLSLEPINGKLNRARISGEPVSIPMASAQFQIFKPGNEKFRDYLLGGSSEFASSIRKREESGEGGLGSWGQWGPEQGLNEFRAYEPLMGDRAKGQVQMWSVNTLPYWQTDNPCFADKTRVQGILTTNAMVYQAGLPTFSKGQLSYQVAGLHNNYDGSEFTGEYTLQMRADDARCLYGYTEAPIQTKVSVTDSAGTQKIATTSVSERGGWLTIRARNFTFSSPKIVVSIKQGKKSKAASTSSVSVGRGKSLAAKTLMSKAKIKAKKGDKLDISVVGAKTTGVSDSGKNLKFKSKGTYYVKVSVARKNGSSTGRVFKVVVK
jgi:hypothetical protein